MKKAIALLSGGLDSTVALHLARETYEIRLVLTFDYGQRAAEREIVASQKIAEKLKVLHQVITLPWYAELISTALVNRKKELPKVDLAHTAETEKSAKAVWVPNRNGLFLNIAAALAEAQGWSIIITGFNREEAVTFPDNTTNFVEAMNRSLSYSTLNQVTLISPTQEMDKVEIARRALALKIKPQDLWWCYEGFDKPCLKCESCLRAKRGFEAAGGTGATL